MVAVERSRLAHWRQSVVRPARGCVFELGAGTGLNLPHYNPGVTVVATDVDSRMLWRARTRAARANATVLLVAADAEALPFRAGVFDDAVIGLALCTIPHPGSALAEVRRAVRSRGAVRLLEHVRAPNRFVASLQDWLTPAWRRLASGCHHNRDAGSTVRRSVLEIEQVIAHAGGSVVEILAQTPAHGVP
jgi:ubiquinone/menaquinone biosynthesis C-methylase UbiE